MVFRIQSDGPPQAPEAWRGNCKCGRWLVLLVAFTEDHKLRCECGRRWYWRGDQIVCEPGKVVPALCVDLDGTVRRYKSGEFISGPSDLELFPDAEAKLWEYRDDGFLIIGVSNQGGVAHGHKTELCQQAEIDATCRAFQRNPFHLIKCCYHDEAGSAVRRLARARRQNLGVAHMDSAPSDAPRGPDPRLPSASRSTQRSALLRREYPMHIFSLRWLRDADARLVLAWIFYQRYGRTWGQA